MNYAMDIGRFRAYCSQRAPAVSTNASIRQSSSAVVGRDLLRRSRQHQLKRCLVSHAGKFAVREITDEDVQTLTDVQTEAFFEPTPFSLLNGWLKSLFRADVLDSMRVKMRSVADGDALILVATPEDPTSADGTTNEPVAILELFVGNSENIISTIEEEFNVERPEKYAWLASMAVDEQFRRQGCAKVLLDAVYKRMSDLECDWAVLSVFPGNTAAISLYESEGYNNCGMRGNAFLDFLGSKSKVLMMRPRETVDGTV